jgi:hypothetical protein
MFDARYLDSIMLPRLLTRIFRGKDVADLDPGKLAVHDVFPVLLAFHPTLDHLCG